MERGSTKHRAQLDESMTTEVAGITHGAPVESRADESREAEPFDTVELGSDIRDDVPEPATPAAIAHEEVTARSEIARFIPPSTYPASADELLAAARSEGATDPVLAVLGRLDASRHYETLQQIWESLGGDTEHRPREGEATGERPMADATAPRSPAVKRAPLKRRAPQREEKAAGSTSTATTSQELEPTEPESAVPSLSEVADVTDVTDVTEELPALAMVAPPGGLLRLVPTAAVRFGFDLAALATWTIAGAVSGVARRIDEVRDRIDGGEGS